MHAVSITGALRAIRADALQRLTALRRIAVMRGRHAQLEPDRTAAPESAGHIDAVPVATAQRPARRAGALVHVQAALRPPVDGHRLHMAAARVRTAAVAVRARLAAEAGRRVVAADERIAGLMQVALVDVVAVGAVAGEAQRTGGTAVEGRRVVGRAFDTCVEVLWVGGIIAQHTLE